MYYYFYDNYTRAEFKIFENGLYIREIIVRANSYEHAILKFIARFGINPKTTTCACCAPRDFSVTKFATFEEANDEVLYPSRLVNVLKPIAHYAK